MTVCSEVGGEEQRGLVGRSKDDPMLPIMLPLPLIVACDEGWDEEAFVSYSPQSNDVVQHSHLSQVCSVAGIC